MSGMLAGRNAIVTGSSNGIGRACAIELARAGARVLVNYHGDANGAAAVVEEIERNGGRAIPFKADVGVEAEVKAMFARAAGELGDLHILVGNAGIQRDAPLVGMTVEQWDAVQNTNLRGQFLCAREAVRAFLRGAVPATARSSGCIVFINSVHDAIPWAGHVNYAAAKGGAAMLMKTLAQELGETGIRINAVSPGAIRTEINRPAWETEAALRDLLQLIPRKRIGEPEDVARAVRWLVSDDADYVHGHTLYVDGGMMLYPSFKEGG